jgi:hypothetical protein
LIAALAATTIVLGGCDETEALTYENATATQVEVFIDGLRASRLEPGESKTYNELLASTSTFEARDDDGTLVYREVLTRDDLRDRDWTVTIIEYVEPLTPTQTPAETQATP